MKLNSKVIRLINLSNDMIDVFNDYVKKLDAYFSIEENRCKNLELYNQYMILNTELKRVIKKNGFDKK